MRIRISLFCAAVILAGRAPAFGTFLPDGSFSDEARGLTAASFLKTPPSARFEALAGACLTQNVPQSFFCNPAGLAFAPKGYGAASFAYESLLEGSYRTGASVIRGSGYGAFAAGLLYNNSSPGMERADTAGGLIGAISAYDYAAGASFARRYGLTDFGFGVKFIKSKLAEAAGSSAVLDAGFVFREPGHTKTEFSLALRNFGPPLKLGSERAPTPLEFGGGLKWGYTRNFDLLLEGRLPSDHSPYLLMAGEWFLSFAPVSGLFVRGGMNFKNYSDLGALGAFAGGFGLKLGALEFDYAFVPYGDLGATHRTEISWRFAGAERVKIAGAQKAKNVAGKSPAKDALVVVAPFENGAGVTEIQASVFRNLFEAELGLKGVFRLIERQKLDFILAEKKLAYSGLSEDKAAGDLGRMTGAELAVFGFVSKEADEYLVTAKIVEVSSGEILRSVTVAAPEEYFFRQAARKLASDLCR